MKKDPKARLEEVRKYIAERTEDGKQVADILLEIARDPLMRGGDRVKACEMLMSYGVGKVESKVDVNQTVTIEHLIMEARSKLIDTDFTVKIAVEPAKVLPAPAALPAEAPPA